MPSSHLILGRPLLLLPTIPPSIRVFSNESTLHMTWPKYWSFSLSTTPSNEHPGLISFRMDWLDLLAVQGTLKSLLQHHSSKASILQHSAFLIVQLSHPYMTTGKTIAWTRGIFIGKVMLKVLQARLLICKDPDAGKDWRWEEKGITEDEMVGWHHWLNGHEFEQVLGVGDGQGSLVCCSPWGCEEWDTTEWLNWTKLWRAF